MAETTTVDQNTERADALHLFQEVVRAALEVGVSPDAIRQAVDEVLDA